MPYGNQRTMTKEQLAAFDAIVDQRFTLGVAKAEYANRVLMRDGSCSPDLDQLTGPTTPAWLVDEITDHIAQGRFLFILVNDTHPLCYYQCAVDGNPDLPPLKG